MRWICVAFILIVCSVAAQGQELIYRLPPNETISFYTRVAPDLSAIAFTKTKEGAFRYGPVSLSLDSHRVTSLPRISYDPTFSPDYNLRARQGFLFGARGGSSNHAKYYSFFVPGELNAPKREFYFSNISGYGSVALLSDDSVLPEVLKPYKGKYLVMGKRWRWFILDTVKNSRGEVIDFVQVYPSSGDRAAAPFCPNLGESSFDRADSFLSPRAQYISLKRNPNKVPVIVRTRDCRVLNTPALAGMYGGKATFSNDERYLSFHAFGENGKELVRDHITNEGYIKELANEGITANLFLYNIGNNRLWRLTHNNDRDPAVNFFPNFSGNGRWIYYHQHLQGASSTTIHRIAIGP